MSCTHVLRFALGLLLCFFSLGFTNSYASEDNTDMGIITGNTQGTYIQIGNNIAALLKDKGFNLLVYSSNGSLDNIAEVYESKHIQLGIVQSDVLAFIKTSQNKALKRIAKKVKLVSPLYNEEIHLLVSNKINSLADLNDKIIAIGYEGSGSTLTSHLLFEILDIHPAERRMLGGVEAIEAVSAGEIDAMIYVGGYPVKLFADLDNEKVHLLSITDKSMSEYYTPSTIPAKTYPWQTEDVESYAVKAVMMSYNYRKKHCDNIGKLTRIIYDNLDWLKENGHSKWKNVDMNSTLNNWERYDCVVRALNHNQLPNNTSSVTKSLLRKSLRDLGSD